MHRPHPPRAVVRSQWFADITAALREAEKLLSLLESDANMRKEAARLRLRVKTVRAELELLHRTSLGEGRVLGGTWPAVTIAAAGKA